MSNKSLPARLRAGLKGLIWGSESSTPWSFNLSRPGAIDYAQEAGDLLLSRVVMAYVNFITDAFPQTRFAVQRRQPDGQFADQPNHRLTELLETPNPDYAGLLLWAPTLLSYTLEGNAYWRIEWNLTHTKVLNLYYLPHFLMRARRESEAIRQARGLFRIVDYYEYWNGGAWQRYEFDEILHFRNGINPHNPMYGLAPLASAIEEIYTDREAGRFIATLLRNMGVPGLIVTPKTAEDIIADVNDVKAKIDSKTTGSERGRALVMDMALDIHRLGWTPSELEIGKIRRTPEATVGALLKISPMAAGLEVGLEHSTYSNMGEARAGAWEDKLMPMAHLMAAELQTQLLPLVGNPASGEVVRADFAQVEALQEGRLARVVAATTAFEKQIARRNEARKWVGLPADPDPVLGDAYYQAPVAAAPRPFKIYMPAYKALANGHDPAADLALARGADNTNGQEEA